MNWFYSDGGKQVGPVSETDLESLVQAGTVRADTLVWREGMSDWQPFSQASGNAAPATGAQVACAECGKVVPQDDAIRYGDAWVCAACKPAFVQKIKEGGTIAGTMEYAGFWIRAAAKILDGLILSVPLLLTFAIVIPLLSKRRNAGAAVVLQLAMQLGFWVISLVYTVYFLGRYGATPGKMACKLRVVTVDGDKISYARAFGRFFGDILSGMICYIGYLMVAFDKTEHRALHDHICGTRVIRVAGST